LQSTERVDVFIEGGHVNTGEALVKISSYKHATEPIEWPEVVSGKLGQVEE
jgi:hypothetical protein